MRKFSAENTFVKQETDRRYTNKRRSATQYVILLVRASMIQVTSIPPPLQPTTRTFTMTETHTHTQQQQQQQEQQQQQQQQQQKYSNKKTKQSSRHTSWTQHASLTFQTWWWPSPTAACGSAARGPWTPAPPGGRPEHPGRWPPWLEPQGVDPARGEGAGSPQGSAQLAPWRSGVWAREGSPDRVPGGGAAPEGRDVGPGGSPSLPSQNQRVEGWRREWTPWWGPPWRPTFSSVDFKKIKKLKKTRDLLIWSSF